jgi:hypothetical protein
MTPEEKAKALLADIMDLIFHDGAEMETMQSRIAQAIRDAEDAAYERAALIAKDRWSRDMTFATAYERRGELAEMQGRVSGAVSANMVAEDILSLKHTKES